MTPTQRGFFVGPLAAVLTVWLEMSLVWVATSDERPYTALASLGSMWLFLFFGTPVAYLIAAVVGAPVFRWLQRHNRLRPTAVILSAAALGGVSLSLLVVAVTGSISVDSAIAASLGFVAGAVGGLAFWTAIKSQASPHPIA